MKTFNTFLFSLIGDLILANVLFAGAPTNTNLPAAKPMIQVRDEAKGQQVNPAEVARAIITNEIARLDKAVQELRSLAAVAHLTATQSKLYESIAHKQESARGMYVIILSKNEPPANGEPLSARTPAPRASSDARLGLGVTADLELKIISYSYSFRNLLFSAARSIVEAELERLYAEIANGERNPPDPWNGERQKNPPPNLWPTKDRLEVLRKQESKLLTDLKVLSVCLKQMPAPTNACPSFRRPPPPKAAIGASNLPVVELRYRDGRKLINLRSDYAYLMDWPKGQQPSLYVFNRPRRSRRQTHQWDRFLQELQRLPDGIEIDEVEKCTVSFAWGMPEANRRELQQVLRKKSIRCVLADDVAKHTCFCNCEAVATRVLHDD